MLGMNPELIGQLDTQQQQKYRQRHAEQRQGQIEGPVEGRLEGALAQGGGQVEILAGVVRLMGTPEQVVAMQGAVRPVETQIHSDKTKQP